MAEHLYSNLLARRPADVFALDDIGNIAHLLQLQFARQDDDIGIGGIELQGFGIGDVELGGKMHLLTDGTAIR